MAIFRACVSLYEEKCVNCNTNQNHKPMNNKQRKQLKALSEQVEEIKQEVEMIRDDEQEKIDNLPDGLIGSSKQDEYQEAVNALEEVISSLEDVIDKFGEATV